MSKSQIKEGEHLGLAAEDFEQLQEKYTGNWVVRAVSAMVDFAKGAPSPKEMAKKLQVPVVEILDALEVLCTLGIIKRTDTSYKKILKYVYYSDRNMEAKKILADHVLITTQVLGRLNPDTPEVGSFYRTGFISSNRELARSFFYKMEELIKDFIIQSSKEESDTVYALSLSGVEVCKEKE